MRWFLTDDVPDLAEKLRAAGEEVVGTSDDWVSTRQHTIRHARDYPLRAHVQHYQPDVVVLVEPLRLLEVPGGLLEFGYFRKHTQDVRASTTLVFYSPTDPAAWEAFQTGRAPGCVCKPADAAVYVSGDAGTVARAKATKRAALWRPGDSIAPVLAAVAHARSRQVYRGKTDAGLW